MASQKEHCDEKIEKVKLELKTDFQKEITCLRKEFLAAFPEEDIRDHLEDHVEMHDKKEDRIKLYRTLRNSLCVTLLLSALATVLGALRAYLKLGG